MTYNARVAVIFVAFVVLLICGIAAAALSDIKREEFEYKKKLLEYSQKGANK